MLRVDKHRTHTMLLEARIRYLEARIAEFRGPCPRILRKGDTHDANA